MNKLNKEDIDSLVGEKRGNCIVLGVSEYAGRLTKYHIQCGCGNKLVRNRNRILSGLNRYCRKCNNNPKTFSGDDLVGQTIGDLLVLSMIEEEGMKTTYKIRCSCGREEITTRYKLLQSSQRKCLAGKHETIQSKMAQIRPSPLEYGGLNRLWTTYRKSARERKYPFELTKEQFIDLTQNRCHYCGAWPTNITTSRSKNFEFFAYIYNGIDRKNNSEGYTIENSVSCCGECNRIKHVLDYTQFIQKCQQIAEYLNEKK